MVDRELGSSGGAVVLSADTQVCVHPYGVCSRLISARDDVVTETGHRLYGGAEAPSWE
jgi:hypothetical protein